VPLGHEKFGKVESCVCRAKDVAQSARARLFAMSNLEQLSHLTFENFQPEGNEKAKFMTPQDKESLRLAFEASQDFARNLKGWLLLEGKYGSGKTHLAAAIANLAVSHGVPTLFITVPDLLDSLRFAYDDPSTTFEQRFEEIRGATLLVLDDFGTQNATPWAQEKLFQIINHRYINRLTTVITTNLMLDEIEGRIRSRLQDDSMVRRASISSPDYRRPEETSNPGINMLAMPKMKEMTLQSFQTREDELGREDVTVHWTEKADRFGNKVKDKQIERVKITKDDIKTLHDAFAAAARFAEEPHGWLTFLGDSFCGKTHLAAAVANYRIGLGGQALMISVSEMLDYLRQTFRQNSDVSFDRRFHEVRSTPLLILDDLKESGLSSHWAEDKFLSILDHRYNNQLPTVITSTMRMEDFAKSYPNLWNKLLDPQMSDVRVINMPAYRRAPKAAKKKKDAK